MDAGALERHVDPAGLEDLAEERHPEPVAEDDCKVTRAHDVPVRREPVRVGEVRMRGADRARLLVHARRKRGLRPTESLGHHLGRVVRGVEEHGVHEVVEPHPLSRMQVDLRRRGVRRELAHGEPIVEAAALEREDRGQDFRRARRRGIAPASRAGLSATTASANSAPIARGDRRVAIVSRVQRIRQLSTTARVRSSTVLTNALLMAFCTELFTPAG